MTEFGRRGALFAGATAMAITILPNLLSGGDIIRVILNGVIASIIFGFGGLLIGNLFQAYILSAARREAVEKEVERELRRNRGNVDTTDSEFADSNTETVLT